jgi:hypothetical protein
MCLRTACASFISGRYFKSEPFANKYVFTVLPLYCHSERKDGQMRP